MHPVRSSDPPPRDRKTLCAVDATTRNRFSASLIANDMINESVKKNIYIIINCYRVQGPKDYKMIDENSKRLIFNNMKVYEGIEKRI